MLCSVHRIASICRVYELAATFVHFAPFIYLLFARSLLSNPFRSPIPFFVELVIVVSAAVFMLS